MFCAFVIILRMTLICCLWAREIGFDVANAPVRLALFFMRYRIARRFLVAFVIFVRLINAVLLQYCNVRCSAHCNAHCSARYVLLSPLDDVPASFVALACVSDGMLWPASTQCHNGAPYIDWMWEYLTLVSISDENPVIRGWEWIETR